MATIRNASQFGDESTPLIISHMHSPWNTSCFDKVLVAALAALFLCGTAFGIYLLFAQCQAAAIEDFDLVSREGWGIKDTAFLQQVPPLRHPLPTVLLVKVITNCTKPQQCLQHKEFERLPFNFYQDGLGTIFEGRGFELQADCHMADCAQVLTVAVLEQRNKAPSNRQLRTLKAFLDYAVMEQALDACFEVMSSHTPSRYFDDMTFTLRKMLREGGACKYYY
ncbi:uncharacterized protein LOC109538846 [Dendroctonus ponderosae]|uniref:uncharacterized protein LOC109538846 n=1 Tax=Dendroctonus ponderosae TaxID=77166 RepID=UPI0020358F96|nr:uncharacterized protein LOC109538846 [Dendroctonus ponderosae]KAH1008894.1 hypothetical protein HUJ05_009395 [Dendroctonus ponderosae]